MATITTTHVWRAPTRAGVYNGSGATIAANLFFKLDKTSAATAYKGGLPGAKAFATSDTLLDEVVLGISDCAIPNLNTGSVCCTAGDIVVAKASGTVTLGEKLTIDTASAKEGWVKTATNAGQTTPETIIAEALETAADGVLLAVRLLVSSGA